MNDNEYVRVGEHQEFVKRMDEANDRLDGRLTNLEIEIKQISKISASVEKLATNMEHMLVEQKDQGKKLEKLEARDGEMWRKVVGYTVTAVVGIVLGYIFTQIGIG